MKIEAWAVTWEEKQTNGDWVSELVVRVTEIEALEESRRLQGRNYNAYFRNISDPIRLVPEPKRVITEEMLEQLHDELLELRTPQGYCTDESLHKRLLIQDLLLFLRKGTEEP